MVGAAKGRGFSFFGIKAWGMPPKGQVTGGWGCAAEERGFLCLKNKTWAWGMSPKCQVTGWVLGGGGVLPRSVVFCVSRVRTGACYPRFRSLGVGCGW